MEEQTPEEKEAKPIEEKPKEELAALIDRLEKANKEKAELLDREERMRAKDILDGVTSAGKRQEKPAEISAREYSEKAIKGEFNKPKEK